jgi:hypothetical protein
VRFVADADTTAADGAPETAPETTPGAPADDRENVIEMTERLVLDELTERLDTLKLLRAGGDDAANDVLAQFGAKGKVELDMLEQLGAWAPLHYPERFEEAHRTAMRALEVFDRNGGRRPSSLKAGPLTPIAAPVVQQLIRIIVRGYQKTVIERLARLYARREANCVVGSHEFMMLRMARIQAERLAPGFQKAKIGLPTFLVGGAAISALGSSLQGLVVAAIGSPVVLLIVAGVFAALALAAFWCIFQAAAIARRRTRIALDRPLRALWETIGMAGDPPRDQSRQFATYAVLLLVATWIVVPVMITIALNRF